MDSASAAFRSEPRIYMRRLALAWIGKKIIWLAVPIIAVAVWSCFDIRAVYVGLMMLFLIYPMAISLVWFNYSFSLQSRRAISQKRVHITDDGLLMEYLPNEENVKPMAGHLIGWHEIKVYEQHSDRTILIIGPRLDDRLEIPAAAFDCVQWNYLFGKLPDRCGL